MSERMRANHEHSAFMPHAGPQRGPAKSTEEPA